MLYNLYIKKAILSQWVGLKALQRQKTPGTVFIKSYDNANFFSFKSIWIFVILSFKF